MPVDIDLAASISGEAPPHDMAILFPIIREEAALHFEAICTFPDRRGICPVADKKLQGREQGRLARASLAGKHGEAFCWLYLRFLDEGNISDLNLVNHLFGHFPVEDARNGRIEALRIVVEEDDVALPAPDTHMHGPSSMAHEAAIGEDAALCRALLRHVNLHDI